MDGSNRKVLIEERLGLPNGLTIDFGSHHVCWVDAGTYINIPLLILAVPHKE
jgi:nidogen (entactin)